MGVIYSSDLVSHPAIMGRVAYADLSVLTSVHRVYFGQFNWHDQAVDTDMSIQIREPGYLLQASCGLGCGAAILRVDGSSSSTGPNTITWSTYVGSSIKWWRNIVPNQCHDGTRSLSWLIAFYHLNSTVYGVATLRSYQ